MKLQREREEVDEPVKAGEEGADLVDRELLFNHLFHRIICKICCDREEERREREMSTRVGRMLCGLQDELMGRGGEAEPAKEKVRAGGR